MPTPGISRVADFEELSRKELPDFLVDYYATGCGDEQTVDDSRRAFQRYVKFFLMVSRGWTALQA